MAYFRIIVKRKGKRIAAGIREMDADIDRAYLHFKSKILSEYQGTDVTFEIVQVSKLSDDVKLYLQKTKRPPIER